MKIISKTYVLVLILIVAAIINLTLLYEAEHSGNTQSYTIIKTGDLKVQTEAISGLAVSIANGNVDDEEKIYKDIEHVDVTIAGIKNGGMINNKPIQKIPPSITTEYNKLVISWNDYKEKALNAKKTSVFDKEATSAMNYVLQKNGELILLTNSLSSELSNLDRDYNRHKEIANDLENSAKEIGQLTLLISIGEEENAQDKIKIEKMKFEVGLRKLLGISTNDLDLKSIEQKNEDLIEIPRENSDALRKLDPLWESLRPKIEILEERALLSPDFNSAKNEMNLQKEILFGDIDNLLNSWNFELSKKGSQEQLIVQILLVVDIVIFFLVLFVIRQSLLPLGLITNALTEIKEGAYGRKIEYEKSDEIGNLVQTFNVMSNTILEKEELAKKTDIAKDEFLAMITHELKTPLVPIQGYSDILLSEHLGKLTDKQKERINIIKSSSETLLALISDLLDAQKLELGQLRMKMETNNIKKTITEVIESFTPQAQKNNIKFISNLKDVHTEYDEDRIKQVLSNLIKNSMIAVEPEKGVIDITMIDYPQTVQVSVKDNGIGIPADKQENLFKKFYQVDTTLTREKSGSGLGLAICKGIIDTHGGGIFCKSIPGQETVFTFTLPKKSESKKSPIGIT
ncbi:ATPase/histidine kinase/DNA gyrase B/HSP90 domain protein [Candidatus Nitrosarchaeum limnium BG20]|uniref:histidine kinase n=1 Tax=Candidatus Nitrosarchaeum limnium BG20 TaxID=859192 RepID=S2E5J8_9ARCH|nr:ATPase/histidine kinase/DNA gyrase B/HSP90 domain protein [Candidatus Nitrosarchaeum limnium BG20]